jgi:predicted acylesterase/phospholipase RssA
MTIEKIGYLPTLQDLKTKFNKTLICITYNLTDNTSEKLSYDNFPNLPCITAIRMSCNLPLIFENYKYGTKYYIDGGIANHFPINIGDEIGNKVLGILLTSDVSSDIDTNILEFIYKLMNIPIFQDIRNKIDNCSSKCDIITLSYYKPIKFFNFNVDSKEKLEMFSFGYQKMKEYIER